MVMFRKYRWCWLLMSVFYACDIGSAIRLSPQRRISAPVISAVDLDSSVAEAMDEVDRRLNVLEPNIYKNGAVLEPGSSAWFAAASAKTKIMAKNVSRMALVAEETTKILAKKFDLSKEQISESLPTVDVRGTALERYCPLAVDFPCQPKKYRAYSGYCNNVQHPKWGNANTRYIRYLRPDYADGVQEPRGSISSGLLPESRLVSRVAHSASERPHPHLTVLMAIFAEFVFHDIFHTSQAAGFRGHRIRCCGVPESLLHPECYAMYVNGSKADDCMEYVRSCSVPRTGCTLGAREQINQVTSFLDGSTIYGSSEEEVRRLRYFQDGEMKMQVSPLDGRTLFLPADTTNVNDCKPKSTAFGNYRCFLAGDVRANENVGLMAMHTVWVREHNRVARRLREINSQWSDDQLFEESRKIVIAELQHVTFSELLPALLGVQVVRQFDLDLVSNGGYYTGYDIDVNPGTSNAIASAVAASLFSMMPSRFHLFAQKEHDKLPEAAAYSGPFLERVGSALTMSTHFSPATLYEGRNTLDKLILGMANQHADSMDPFVANNVDDEDDDALDHKDDMDHVALIIQQGRDHGIPSYLQWRKICRLHPTITTFTDLRRVMTEEAATRIASVYKDVRDIDLFTGGVSENPVVGGVVGPTFACLLSRQFQHLRRGDRHWYENDLPPAAFTLDQLREIKKTTLSRILCDNSDDLPLMQPSVMFMPDPYLNAFQKCETGAPSVDLSKWETTTRTAEIPAAAVISSLRAAKTQAEKRMASEWEIFRNNVGVAKTRSPQAMHHVFLRPKRQSNLITNLSLVLELASQNFMRRAHLRDAENKPSDTEVAATMLALSTQDIQSYLQDLSTLHLKGREERIASKETVRVCQDDELPCDHTNRFRSSSGWCNNIQNPEWGKAFLTFQRLLPPHYEDGVSAPRALSVTGKPLPSPRIISTTVHYDTHAPHARYTLALMQWGQFIDHDITLTPMYDAPGGRPLDCKSCDSTTAVHPECLPIPIPEDDPFFPFNQTVQCISFARSLAGQLTLGQREQLNQVTAFLDASSMYGSDACEARMLRSFREGQLNSTRQFNGGKELLPQDAKSVECRAPSGYCFISGDGRASEQPALAVMHTIWLREHNRIAEELSDVNPHWNDEILYQHARRIVSALMQHITYEEFLPRVLGEALWKQFGLNSVSESASAGGKRFEYDPTCDATIFNEFATAAFRFGHTLLKPMLPRLDETYSEANPADPLLLRKTFFNPDILYEAGAMDQLVRGLLGASVEVFDHSVTSEVTNHLFEDRVMPFSGMDLVALNVQRGRDHGLPPYNEYRVLCNHSRARNFEDLLDDIPQHIVRRLQRVYEHVDDIDLFTGGVSEKPMYGALVGPIFGCIIGLQFQYLKKCDRLWYETDDPFLKFTPAQLSEIRQRRLSKVLCDNSDNVNAVQQDAFDLPDDFRNPRMPCSSLKKLDLSHWKESEECTLPKSDLKTSMPVGHSSPMSPCVTCACTKEGLVCQSLKISNCFQLASKYSMEAVLADSVCKVQCAFAFRAYPQFESSLPLDNRLGFSQPDRSL